MQTSCIKPKSEIFPNLQQLHCALRLLFYLEDFPLGIEAVMAAEGKPTPSGADFPSSIRMCHSFSAAWHHSEMDALGREREQTLIPAPNTFGRCMGCCLNNLISTLTHTWLRHMQGTNRVGMGSPVHPQLHTALHATGTGNL